MLGWLFGSRERRPRSRLAGCLVWIVALIVLLIVLSLLFGGFRKGTKAAGTDPPMPVAASPVVASPSVANPVR